MGVRVSALDTIKATCQSHSVDGCDECEYHNYWDKWDETITCQFSRVPGNWAVEQIEGGIGGADRACKNLRGNDDEFECSECNTICLDFSMLEHLNPRESMFRHYPDYCPCCGAKVE